MQRLADAQRIERDWRLSQTSGIGQRMKVGNGFSESALDVVDSGDVFGFRNRLDIFVCHFLLLHFLNYFRKYLTVPRHAFLERQSIIIVLGRATALVTLHVCMSLSTMDCCSI